MADVKLLTSTPDVAAGNPIDGTSVTTGAGVVDRQRVSIADSQTATDAQVTASGLKVDGSGVTQPVSGTFFPATQAISAAALPLPAGAATEATLALVKAKTDNLDVLLSTRTKPSDTQPVSAVALPLPTGASTAALQTQPGVDIGDVTVNNAAGASAVNIQDGGNSLTVDGTVTTTPPANASTNVAQVAGTAADVNSGLKSAGTLRVVLATDQPALTNKLLVTPDALPANQSVNVNQIGGAAITEGQKAMASSVPVVLASDQTTLPAVAEARASTLHVTGTAAVNTALTITLPAAGVGLFHYITSIQWIKLYSVVGVANGAGVLITTTNLPGNPVFTTEQLASPAGTAAKVVDYQPTTPLKSSVANTATTIVAPLQLQTIWRGNVSYFTGA